MTTKGEWVAYTGSDEQIAEIHSPHNDVLLKSKSGKQYFKGARFLNHEDDGMTHYLICNPHPLADMICQQARTGQRVYIDLRKCIYPYQSDPDDSLLSIVKDGRAVEIGIATCNPNWNTPNAEYSFTAFKE